MLGFGKWLLVLLPNVGLAPVARHLQVPGYKHGTQATPAVPQIGWLKTGSLLGTTWLWKLMFVPAHCDNDVREMAGSMI